MQPFPLLIPWHVCYKPFGVVRLACFFDSVVLTRFKREMAYRLENGITILKSWPAPKYLVLKFPFMVSKTALRPQQRKKDLYCGLPQTLLEIPASSLALSLAHFSRLQATHLSADHVRHEQQPALSPSGFLHMIFRKAPTQTVFLFFVFVSALLFFPCPDSEVECYCGCLSHNGTLLINCYTLEASMPG